MQPDDLRKLAENSRPNYDSYTNCGYINRKIAESLRESLEGCSVELVDGTVWQGRALSEEHSFIKVSGEPIGWSSEVIVDGAIRQFCDENKDHKVWVSFGSRDSIPEVAVIPPDGNDWKRKYSDRIL